MLCQEDVRTLTLLKLSLLDALFGEIIPSLRCVLLKWKPGDRVAFILFYHDGIITSEIEDHYSYIYAESGTEALDVDIDFEIIRCDYPSPVPAQKDCHPIYERKEPFVDPT